MAYTFDRVAYKARSGQNFRYDPDDPPNPQSVRGYKVVVYDTEGGGDVHQFWVMTHTRFYSDEEWYVFIGAHMSGHGMPLEDEPPPDFEPPPDEDYDEDYDEEDEEDEEPETPTFRQRVINVVSRIGRWFR